MEGGIQAEIQAGDKQEEEITEMRSKETPLGVYGSLGTTRGKHLESM